MTRSVQMMARHFEYEIEKIAKNAGFPEDVYREKIAAELIIIRHLAELFSREPRTVSRNELLAQLAEIEAASPISLDGHLERSLNPRNHLKRA